MAFPNWVLRGLAGFDEYFILPEFSINMDVFFFGKSCICTGTKPGQFLHFALFLAHMIFTGAVVTKDVPDYALVAGVPAQIIGRVDKKGNILEKYKG